MAELHGRCPSEWRRHFLIANDLVDQLRKNAGGYDFEWSFGGGTAMMIQIGHRESHDIDIFLNDPQLLGFIDPSKSELSFELMPSAYQGDGTKFQKFAFENVGEIDFIVAGALTQTPFELREVEGRAVRLDNSRDHYQEGLLPGIRSKAARHLRYRRCCPFAIGGGREGSL